MKKSSDLISMPIISLEEGTKIGSVKNLLIDPGQKKVAALIIEEKGFFKGQKIVPFNKIRSIGPGAITLDKTGSAETATSLPELMKLLQEPANLIGAKVVAENGTILGQIEEYYVDPSSGDLISLDLKGNLLESFLKGRARLSISQIQTIGQDMVIASDGAENQLISLDGGFQETVRTFKDTTTIFWEATLKKPKELSKNLNKKTLPAEPIREIEEEKK